MGCSLKKPGVISSKTPISPENEWGGIRRSYTHSVGLQKLSTPENETGRTASGSAAVISRARTALCSSTTRSRRTTHLGVEGNEMAEVVAENELNRVDRRSLQETSFAHTARTTSVGHFVTIAALGGQRGVKARVRENGSCR